MSKKARGKTLFERARTVYADQKFFSWATALLLFVGTVGGGYAWFDTTYARASAVEKRFVGFEQSMAKREWNDLRREETAYLQENLRRALSDVQLDRLREVQDALERLSRELGVQYQRMRPRGR